jgi:predicted RecB family nuclease
MSKYYSHTKLDVARKCMLMYKFQYVDKIKIDGDTAASDFGSLIHGIAEEYKGGGKIELLALYHKGIETYKLTDFYKAKVPLALQNVHEYWKAILANEEVVKEVKHESDITVPLNETLTLNGKIDIVIEQKNGRFRIVDYKTNKSNAYANHNNQLSMYMLMLNKKYGIPYDKMDCEVVYLAMDAENKKGDKIKNSGYDNISKIYKLEECDVECLISEIETIDKAIEKSIAKNEWKARPGKFACTYCPFNPLCDKKWVPESNLTEVKHHS